MIDALELSQDLIRCPSVTPIDAGALDVLQKALEELGFKCTRLPFQADGTERVDNLYARLGTEAPNFCFAGHTDVVPVGDAEAWSVDPFAAEVKDGVLIGRGATDMKTAIACFAEAVDRVRTRDRIRGSISFLITGDEEGPAINGTVKVLEWLAEQGEELTHCLVGEPTNPTRLGEMAKIGRRGSLNGTLTCYGAQGHVAYPHLAANPVPRLIEMLSRIAHEPLDSGNDCFQPSNLEITTVDVGNPATNVIPAKASARFNVRFNTEQTGEGLIELFRAHFDAVTAEMGGHYDYTPEISGDCFLTEPGPFSALIADAVEKALGVKPELSTTGGTSDARFIKNYCPVIEFGLIGQSMHKVDEHVAVADIRSLTDIYEQILDGYFRQTL